MPPRSKKPCGHRGCKELSTEAYCNEHRQERHQLYKRERTDHDEQSFYKSAVWRKTRAYKLRMNPLCEECMRQGRLRTAVLVDHITPIKKGGARLDVYNLQSLCQSCHNRKTAGE